MKIVQRRMAVVDHNRRQAKLSQRRRVGKRATCLRSRSLSWSWSCHQRTLSRTNERKRRRLVHGWNQTLVLQMLDLLRVGWQVRQIGLLQQKVARNVDRRVRNHSHRSSIDRYRVWTSPLLKMNPNLGKDTDPLRDRGGTTSSSSLHLRSSLLLRGAPYSLLTDSLALSRSLNYDLRGRRSCELSLPSVELRNVQPADCVPPESQNHSAKSQSERDSTIAQGHNPSSDSLARTGRQAALPDEDADPEGDGENPANGQSGLDPAVAVHGFGCHPLSRHLIGRTFRAAQSGSSVELFRRFSRTLKSAATSPESFRNNRTTGGPVRTRAVRKVPHLAVLQARIPGRSAVLVHGQRLHDRKRKAGSGARITAR